MATTKTEAQKVEALRKQAMDKSLPQEVRDMADKKANEIEGRSVQKATGVKLAKGGAVKKMMYGGMAEKTMMAKGGMPMVEKGGTKVPAFAADGVGKMAKGGAVKAPMKTAAKQPMKKMMMGGAVVAKAPAKDLPMRGQRTATNMAKGGSVAKKAKK